MTAPTSRAPQPPGFEVNANLNAEELLDQWLHYNKVSQRKGTGASSGSRPQQPPQEPSPQMISITDEMMVGPPMAQSASSIVAKGNPTMFSAELTAHFGSDFGSPGTTTSFDVVPSPLVMPDIEMPDGAHSSAPSTEHPDLNQIYSQYPSVPQRYRIYSPRSQADRTVVKSRKSKSRSSSPAVSTTAAKAVEDMKAENAELKRKNEELKRAMVSHAQRATSTELALSTAQTQMSREKEAAEQVHAMALREVEVLRAQVSEMLSRQAETDRQTGVYVQQLRDASSIVAQYDDECAGSREQMKMAASRTRELVQQLENADQTIQASKRAEAERQQQVSEWTSQMESMQRDGVQMQQQNVQLWDHIRKLDNIIAQKSQDLDYAQGVANEFHGKVQSMVEERNQVQSRLDVVEKQHKGTLTLAHTQNADLLAITREKKELQERLIQMTEMVGKSKMESISGAESSAKAPKVVQDDAIDPAIFEDFKSWCLSQMQLLQKAVVAVKEEKAALEEKNAKHKATIQRAELEIENLQQDVQEKEALYEEAQNALQLQQQPTKGANSGAAAKVKPNKKDIANLIDLGEDGASAQKVTEAGRSATGTSSAKNVHAWSEYLRDARAGISSQDDERATSQEPAEYESCISGTLTSVAVSLVDHQEATDPGGDTNASIVGKLDSANPREPKKITVPPWPNINSLTDWKAQLAGNVVAASIYHDKKEVAWLNEISTKSFAQLSNDGPDRMCKISALLYTAVHAIIPNKLRKKVTRLQTLLVNQGRTMTGRQLLHAAYAWFKTSEHMETMYGFEALKEMEWLGDDRIEEFLDNWEHITDNLDSGIGETAKRDILHTMMQKSNDKNIRDDLGTYRRARTKNGPEYSLGFLQDILSDRIDTLREEENVAARKAGLNRYRRNKKGVDAAPAIAKPKAKKKPAAAAITATRNKSKPARDGRRDSPAPERRRGASRNPKQNEANRGRTRSRDKSAGARSSASRSKSRDQSRRSKSRDSSRSKGSRSSSAGSNGQKGTKRQNATRRGRTPQRSGQKNAEQSKYPYIDLCYFYNKQIRGGKPGCRHRSSSCPKKHTRVPDQHWPDYPVPMRSKSPGPRKRRDASASAEPPHCRQFLRTGTCKWTTNGGVCKWPHLDKGEYRKAKKALQ